ncbi:MAG: aspartyl protease family protein [Candidatus Rokubacteria bacterium]|nr:aspartyl protease family protein [Candidatus Rokubacteria bacterium]
MEATVHGAHTLTLALDTDAVLTLLSPAAAARLGLGPASDAPRRSVAPPGRREVEVPLVRVTAIQVGESLVENLEVGVVDVYPEAPKVDGVLGRDFLGRFGVTLDLAARRLRLRPMQPGAR